ncbi:unnamed protein product [Paramecium sonneborni]|uniref:Uncharacterized protein n=1 Tax=Paramecium sonneborni TaxID=65129 RepID=A0A8S1K060_9CILI|nr:unnamed protein product [Paramecium sonneborni]
MEFLGDLDFLPGSINPKLKGLIYIITLLHVLAVFIWIALLCRQAGKKSNTFQSYVEQVMGEGSKIKHH